MPWIAWHKLCFPKSRGGLGFRDFNKFILALLGNQAWRLMTEGRSLMARVLKAKYFPNTSYTEADIGANPSYTWRSIWEARDVVKLGARKRVGNGKDTRVWSDPWIPNTKAKRAMSPRGNSNEQMRVEELMVPGERPLE
ncbi:putative mitochondrial protein AtMg00310 [Silene latifolia]|uniref:putative mitochondrial protein AtMg00310 n=1 Tax=Silene latifolia TaxID=37657 RepID=UPI003D78A878